MNQLPLPLKPKTEYIVKYKGKERSAWFTCGKFIFNNYFMAEIEDCEIIKEVRK